MALRVTYLRVAVLLPAELDLAEFTFTNGVAENEVAEFGRAFM